ncbi:branched-chain alpha-keto acid dehydrogenase subunit E2, partial [Stenotrophomonas maltophilia]
AGTVVGAMQSSNTVHAEQALAVGGVKAVPAVRAMARKLGAAERDDAGTVVGAMQSSNTVHAEQALAVGGVKAVPAVRA